MTPLIDGTGYLSADIALAVLVTLSALLTYARIAFEIVPTLRMPVSRTLMAVGWTVLSLRFWITLATTGDVTVAPVSLVALGMVTSGYCIVQLRAIRRSIALSRSPIHCYREPELPCMREDRVAEVLKK
jgi:hypothetical protein